MKTTYIIILIIYSLTTLGQKSNLYQVFADDINQQTFIDKKTTHIVRKGYDYDTISKTLKQTSDIKIDYLPDKGLCKTYNSWYKSTDYWKSDSNGYNNFNYDRRGKIADKENQDTVSPLIENNKVKKIYNCLLFYDKQNKITKTISDTTNPFYSNIYYQECYFSYKHDSLTERRCYTFRYLPSNTNFNDTLSKTLSTYRSSGSVDIITKKNKLIKIIKYSRDNVDIEETYVNGIIVDKVETYYK